MRITLAAAVSVFGIAPPAGAHERVPHAWTAAGALSIWDLAALAGLTISGLLYVRGVYHLQMRGAVQPRRERLAFAIGWSALAVAMLPPLDALAVELFSLHMVQHELMMLVAVPLMIVGRPLSTCLWGLPARWRRSGGTLLQVGPAAAAIRLLGAPVVAWALHGIAIWVWHAPALYDAAVGNEAVHALQHATFVSTAALFWWGLIYGRYGRAGYGAAVFFVFTTVVHTGLLGAILTLADVPLYRAYLRTAAARGLDPLQDQQLAGLVMWIPAGVILTLVGIALFAAWIGEAERRQRATMVAVLAIATAVTACDASPERIARELTGGDPARGRDAVRTYGCDTCHTIPGVLSADATVGPPLTGVAVRTYLAGRIQNTPENLMQWIRSPHTIDEKTAMPETGVTEQDSRDIAAFLYTLR